MPNKGELIRNLYGPQLAGPGDHAALGGLTVLLPDLEQEALFNRYNSSVHFIDPANLEAIDTDHDGALGPRELRSAADLLDRTGCMADGELDRSRLPRTPVGRVSHGHPRRALGPRPPSGLGWFDGMDRNRDGDISAGEWDGDAGLFRDLDRDGDKLLSPEEAGRRR